MIDPTMTNAQQQNATKSITFNVNSSFKRKSRGGNKSKNKCLYCGSDLKTQKQQQLLQQQQQQDLEQTSLKTETFSKNNNNCKDKDNNRQHDIKEIRKKRNLSLWHKTRYWYYKNRKHRYNGCQCGANGEFEFRKKQKNKTNTHTTNQKY